MRIESSPTFLADAAAPTTILTIEQWEFRFDMFFEHRHNIIDDIDSLRTNIFMILWPISRRNANDALIAYETSELGARMNVVPFFEYQILIRVRIAFVCLEYWQVMTL